MGITNELKQTLKRLRLSGLLATLPDRVPYAKGTKLSYTEFLELILNDEIQRRTDTNVATRLKSAMVDLDQTFERFDWDAAITVDRDRLKDLFSLEFIKGLIVENVEVISNDSLRTQITLTIRAYVMDVDMPLFPK